MTPLTRPVRVMLIGGLLFALVGSVATHTLTTRQALRTQLQWRNDDGAMRLALALTLAQTQGDADRLQHLAAAQFDAGHYRQLRLLRTDGSVLFEREQAALAAAAPAWFARLLSVDSKPGVAQLSDGRQSVGRLELQGQSAWVVDALWAGGLRMAAWLAALGGVAALIVATVVRGWREPRSAGCNHAARTQAAQLDELRAQAHRDAVTGLPNRRQFIARLDASLQAEGHRGAGLLLVRLRRLQAMNRRIGHDATDRLLAALAQVLDAYPQRVKGAFAGRLNGTDFALYLPAPGLAAETASALLDALRTTLVTVDHGADLVIGGTDLPHAVSVAAALSLADNALARAESAGPFAMQVSAGAPANATVLGQRQWQARIELALKSGRLALAPFEVCDSQGELLHLDCPLHLQFEAGGPFEPAVQWLAMAVRCRLIDQLDLAAIKLALAAVQRDGLPRCVGVSAASLATTGFIAQVHQRLEAAPLNASQLSIDFAEGAALQAIRVHEASALWRPMGVRIGLKHSSTALRDLSRLHGTGLDYIKIDGALVQGVSSVPAVAELARGLVALSQGMDVQILATAVEDESDLAALWSLGFDGAAGPALKAVSAESGSS